MVELASEVQGVFDVEMGCNADVMKDDDDTGRCTDLLLYS